MHTVGNVVQDDADTQSPLLIIGNKRYSSWSLRPWLLLRMNALAFTEKRIALYQGEYKQEILRYSPAGKVPVLVDETTVVWESLAICEYAAENFALHHGWPLDYQLRAQARAICSEMHGGFAALRNECGMNVARQPATAHLTMAACADVKRIKTIWTECLAHHGGPFLYGGFSIADAFYAPVVLRFDRYQLLDKEDKSLQDYVDRMLALPPMHEWIAAGCAEIERLPQFEH